MIPLDPYSLLLRTAQEVFELRPDFCELVPVGNRIWWIDGSGDPIKEAVTSADFPEFSLGISSSKPFSIVSSNTVSDTVTLTINAASGDKRVGLRHLPLRWCIFRALMGLQEAMRLLTWNGHKLCDTIRMQTVEDGQSKEDIKRNVYGWSGRWTVTADLLFNRADIQASDYAPTPRIGRWLPGGMLCLDFDAPLTAGVLVHGAWLLDAVAASGAAVMRANTVVVTAAKDAAATVSYSGTDLLGANGVAVAAFADFPLTEVT
jgi:hypothetical protein